MKAARAIAALLFATTPASVLAESRTGELSLQDLPTELVELHENRPDACDPFDIVDSPPYAYELGDGLRFYLIPCSEGAYNRFYAAYAAYPWGYELQSFATYQLNGGWVAEPGVWQPRFDPETLTLSTYNLGRSIGDCGVSQTYVWDGSRFVLIQVSAKPECDGQGAPGEFPLIYERRN